MTVSERNSMAGTLSATENLVRYSLLPVSGELGQSWMRAGSPSVRSNAIPCVGDDSERRLMLPAASCHLPA